MLLQDLVTAIDAALERSAESVLLRAIGDPPEVACRPLEGLHPLQALLGFTAPAHWRGLGLRCPGSARRPGARDAPPRDVMLTILVDRDGHGAGVLREEGAVTPLPGSPDGALGDACRRALGLPTGAPPATTVELWLRIWLDRLVDSVALLGRPERFASWTEVAALHPAAGPDAGHPVGDPVVLADATRQLAAAWPWCRLRREPEAADTPQPPPARHVTEWMDDGMYARWTLSSLPAIEDLAAAVEGLLPASTAAAVAATVTAAGVSWPIPAQGMS